MSWYIEPERPELKGWRRGERLAAGLGVGVVAAAAVAFFREPCVADCAQQAYSLGLLPLAGAVLGGWYERRAARTGRVPYAAETPQPVPERPPSRLVVPTLEQVLAAERSKTL